MWNVQSIEKREVLPAVVHPGTKFSTAPVSRIRIRAGVLYDSYFCIRILYYPGNTSRSTKIFRVVYTTTITIAEYPWTVDHHLLQLLKLNFFFFY